MADTPSLINISAPLPVVLVTPEQKNQRMQEWVRAGITGTFLMILIGIVVWSCVESRSWATHWLQTKEMLQIILPAVTGLLGSSLGFYFGNSKSSQNSSSGIDASQPQ